jgi:hypothetical protein
LSDDVPRIERLDLKALYTVRLCSPVREQIEKIEVCHPNLEIATCNPAEIVKCLPDIMCYPIIGPCLPDTWCLPLIGPCTPVIGPCQPYVYGPSKKIDEVMVRVERLSKEIEAIKRKIR